MRALSRKGDSRRAVENAVGLGVSFLAAIFHRRMRCLRYEIRAADSFRERARRRSRACFQAQTQRALAKDQAARTRRGKLDRPNTRASISAARAEGVQRKFASAR